MANRKRSIARRDVLKNTAAAIGGAALIPGIFRPALAAPQSVKIGVVGPKTGPLALMYGEMSWAIEQTRKVTNNLITINGTKHPLEIVTKDTQSNPNRASEVTQELILKDKVHLVVGFSTPETVTPVADQCELNGVPCITNDDPLESYFFGRKGDPKKPFDWTYNYFFSGREAMQAIMAAWGRIGTNRKIGVLWANDDDGRIFAKVMPAQINDGGFTIVDPGRFDLPASDYTPEISKFKSEGAEIVWTIVPGPDFTIFWNQCAQQKFTPKIVTAGKVGEFPQGVYPYGNRAVNFLQEVWWSKYHPYASSLTGQTSRDLADEYEKDANQQASMALGFRHSLFEIALASLKATQKLDDPASIRNAVRDSSFKTIVGPVDFKTGPFPNTSLTPLVAGQWRKGSKWPLEMVVVDNKLFPEIPVNGQPEPMQYI